MFFFLVVNVYFSFVANGDTKSTMPSGYRSNGIIHPPNGHISKWSHHSLYYYNGNLNRCVLFFLLFTLWTGGIFNKRMTREEKKSENFLDIKNEYSHSWKLFCMAYVYIYWINFFICYSIHSVWIDTFSTFITFCPSKDNTTNWPNQKKNIS